MGQNTSMGSRVPSSNLGAPTSLSEHFFFELMDAFIDTLRKQDVSKPWAVARA